MRSGYINISIATSLMLVFRYKFNGFFRITPSLRREKSIQLPQDIVTYHGLCDVFNLCLFCFYEHHTFDGLLFRF